MYDARSVYGATPQTPSYGVAAPTAGMATDDITSGWKGLIDPANPLMWIGVILLVTVGAAGVAGSARLGRTRVSASVNQA